MSGAGSGLIPLATDSEPMWDDYLFSADDATLYSEIDDQWGTDPNVYWGITPNTDENGEGISAAQGFPNYVPQSTDPGSSVFVFVFVYTLILVGLLPMMVIWGRRWEEQRKRGGQLEYVDATAEAMAAAAGQNGEEGGEENAELGHNGLGGLGSVAEGTGNARGGGKECDAMSQAPSTVVPPPPKTPSPNRRAAAAAAAAKASSSTRTNNPANANRSTPGASANLLQPRRPSEVSGMANNSELLFNPSPPPNPNPPQPQVQKASSPNRGRILQETSLVDSDGPGNESFESALRQVGGDDSLLRSMMQSNDTGTGAPPNSPGAITSSYTTAGKDGTSNSRVGSILSNESVVSGAGATTVPVVAPKSPKSPRSPISPGGRSTGSNRSRNRLGRVLQESPIGSSYSPAGRSPGSLGRNKSKKMGGAKSKGRVLQEKPVSGGGGGAAGIYDSMHVQAGGLSVQGIPSMPSLNPQQQQHPNQQQHPYHPTHGDHTFARFAHFHGPHPSGPRSTVSAAPSAMTTMSRFNRKVNTTFEHLADRIFIPAYPDDAASNVSGAESAVPGRVGRARTTISAATTSRLIPNGNAPNGNGGVPLSRVTRNGGNANNFAGALGDSFHRPRVVDALGRPGAGGGGGRRRRGRRGLVGGGAIGRPDMIRRAIEHEERSEMGGGGGGRSDVAGLGRSHVAGAGGGGANRSEVGAGRSAMSAAQGGLAASPGAINANASRVSGPASEMMSGLSGFHRPAWMTKGGSRVGGGYARSHISGAGVSEVPSVWKNLHEDDITPGDAADADDPGMTKLYVDEMDVDLTVCCGEWALWKPKTVAYGVEKVVELAEPDNEIKRIIRLGVPYTLSTISEALFDAIIVAIISQTLGTNAVTAYVVVDLLIGLTDELVAGIIDAEGTICSHAYGAGNNFLAGQYVQIAIFFYTVCSIPLLCMWCFIMPDALRVFGFNEDIQTIGTDFTRVVVFNYIIEGFAEGFGTLLDITGHEYFGLFFDIVHNVVNLIAVVCLVTLVPDARLVQVGFVELVVSAIFLVVLLTWVIVKGWFSSFWGGMIGSVAICNVHAMKNVIFTAIPLSIGSFLEYGEWELLTFFCAYLGPAEVATWALLGTVWELFEASTEGMGEAAAVRVAYHLGKGRPDMAELSSYKSLLLSFSLSFFITAIFFLCGYDLPKWFSSDQTIQRMLADLIPLVGFGNITMTFGMVCWSLVGAQGRYRLATFISMISSWFITIPLAVIFIIGFKINLKGLVGSVIAGYTTSGVILLYILLRSDWERLSKIIRELNAQTGEIDSSDSEEEYSSASSKDSSSDDDSDSDDSDDSSDDDSSSSGDNSDLNISNISQQMLLA